MWERAIALAQQAGNRETAAIYTSRGGGVRSAFRESGSGEGARPGGTGHWPKAAMWSTPRRLRWRSQASSSGSQRLAEDLAKRFPEDTPVQFEYLPTLRRAFRALPAGAVGRGRAAATGASLRLRDAGHGVLRQVRRPLSRVCARRGVPGSRARPGGGGGISKSPGSSRHRSCRSRSAPWRTCNWAEPTLSRATRPRPKAPTRTSSRSGRMPTRTSPSSNRPGRNTRSSSDFARKAEARGAGLLLCAETLERGLFVGVGLENGEKLGDLQKVVHSLLQVQQFHLAASAGDGCIAAD